MTIYIILIVSIILLGTVCKNRGVIYDYNIIAYRSDKQTNRYLIIIGLFLIFIAACRADIIGIDTMAYKAAYESDFKYVNLIKSTRIDRFEPGFSFVNKLLNYIGGFFWLKLFVVSVNVILIFKTINRYSSLVWFSCLLYFIFAVYRSNINEMRQAIAVGITMYGFQYVISKDIKKYLICVGVAFLFHVSSIIMLPLIFFSKLDKIKIKHIVIFGISFVALYLYCVFFLDFINYIGRNEYSTNEETGGWALFALQTLTITIAFILKDRINKSRPTVMAFFFVCIALVIFPICHLNPNFFRLEFFTWSYMIILVPNMLKMIDNRLIRNLGVIGYSAIGLFQAFAQTYTVDTQFVPYLFFWE